MRTFLESAPPLVLTATIVLLGTGAGCALLPLETSRVPRFSSRQPPEVAVPMREVVGVIHVHSTYSDGTGSVEAIARMAQAQGLDYLILTDHNTLAGRREGRAGWYGSTLVMVDQEISTADGHVLALGLPDELPSRRPGQWTLDRIRDQGGLSFLAHPAWKRKPWRDREVRGMTGLEIYDAPSDIGEECRLILAVATLLAGGDLTLSWWLDRPGSALELWDRWLARGQRLVGIGSGDAHGLSWFGLRLGPYGPLFRLVRNHLWIEGPLTEQAVYQALRRGRVFVAHDVVADARGFRFLAVAKAGAGGDRSLVAVMGEEVRQADGVKLYVYLPSPGELSLWKDGHRIAQARGQQFWFEPKGPGAYRVEATRKGRPWIYSNPIYVIE